MEVTIMEEDTHTILGIMVEEVRTIAMADIPGLHNNNQAHMQATLIANPQDTLAMTKSTANIIMSNSRLVPCGIKVNSSAS